MTNGFTRGSGRKGSKPESFLVYREEARRQRTSSDSDTTSSTSSVEARKRKGRKVGLKHSKPFLRRSSYSVGEHRRMGQTHSPASSNAGDSDDAHAGEPKPAVARKRRRTTGSNSSTEEDGDSCRLEALDLVWAKCRGYPSYPALIIDPHMPRTGYFHNGVPIPVPPFDVLKVGKAKMESNHRHKDLYLVLFFDNKRTWQWLPPTKLKPLGLDEKSDRLKLFEGKRPGIRKSVTQAYHRAILHKSKVSGEIPDSDDEVPQEVFAEEEDSSDSVN